MAGDSPRSRDTSHVAEVHNPTFSLDGNPYKKVPCLKNQPSKEFGQHFPIIYVGKYD
jgi:hypothetical protein